MDKFIHHYGFTITLIINVNLYLLSMWWFNFGIFNWISVSVMRATCISIKKFFSENSWIFFPGTICQIKQMLSLCNKYWKKNKKYTNIFAKKTNLTKEGSNTNCLVDLQGRLQCKQALSSRHAIFREYWLSVPSTLQCSGYPGNI